MDILYLKPLALMNLCITAGLKTNVFKLAEIIICWDERFHFQAPATFRPVRLPLLSFWCLMIYLKSVLRTAFAWFFFFPSCGWNGSTQLKARTWIIHAPPPLWGDSSILISQGDTGTCYWNINTNSHAACSRRAVQVSGDSCRVLLFALRRVTAALVPAAFSICKFNSRGRSQDPAACCQ